MVAIETEHGRFEAETHKQALRLARTAEREAGKRAAEHQATVDRAAERARSAGYHLYRFALRPEGPPSAVRWVPLSHPTVERSVTPERDCFGRVSHKVRYETEHGTAEERHYGHRLKAKLQNAAGWDIAVLLTDGERNEMLAVGTHDGVARFASLPGIAPEAFTSFE